MYFYDRDAATLFYYREPMLDEAINNDCDKRRVLQSMAFGGGPFINAFPELTFERSSEEVVSPFEREVMGYNVTPLYAHATDIVASRVSHLKATHFTVDHLSNVLLGWEAQAMKKTKRAASRG